MTPAPLLFLLLSGITLGLPAQEDQVPAGVRGSEGSNLLRQPGTWNAAEGELLEQVDYESAKLRTSRRGSTGTAIVPIKPCGPILGPCRLSSTGSGAQMHVTATCFCNDGEDVTTHISQLAGLTCPVTAFWENKTHNVVARSTLFIKGCSISSGVFSSELLRRLRQTHSFHVTLTSVPHARLQVAQRVHTVPVLEVKIDDSVVTGLHEGWFGNTEELQFSSSNSDLGVIGSRTFAGYGAKAKAKIRIFKSNITNILQDAFQLPKSGEVLFNDVRLQNVNNYAFSGGSVVNITNSVILRLEKYAFNLYGIGELTLSNSTFGNVEQDVVFNQAPIDIRTLGTIDDDARTAPNVSIYQNNFMRIWGRSFQWFCDVDRLYWTENTVVTLIDSPLRLKDENCTKDRDWGSVFPMKNWMDCRKCFNISANLDDQVCSLYDSSYCHSCEKKFDNCDKWVPDYISKKCTDDSLEGSLESKCRASRAVQFNSAVNLYIPSVLIIVSAITVFFLATEEHLVK